MIKRKRKADSSYSTFYDVNNMASYTECTGLIPRCIEGENEAENYAELYSIHKPIPQKDN